MHQPYFVLSLFVNASAVFCTVFSQEVSPPAAAA
jgi:hypothetical protein